MQAPAAIASARAPGGDVAGYGAPSAFESGVTRVPAGATVLAFSPLANQRGIITPSGLFFTRNHSGVPRIDPRRHELLVDGRVRRPRVFRVDDLLRFPSVARIHFIECAGNTSAGWQSASAPDVQHSHGLASCAEWTGVPVRLLLEEAGLEPDAAWALARGADGGVYERSIPLAKLLDDALVVYGQNGEMLRPEQGFPLRLLLPGYEGSANVKWLDRLTLGRAPWYTREETAEYTELLPGGRARAFNFIMDAKSVITFPSAGQRLKAPGYHELRGFAWSGRGRIAQVDVSLDGGHSWSQATLSEPVLPRCFTRFTHDFSWDGSPTTVLSRAVDETGYVQPDHHALVAARGVFSEYHYNAIAPWRIDASGAVSDARA